VVPQVVQSQKVHDRVHVSHRTDSAAILPLRRPSRSRVACKAKRFPGRSGWRHAGDVSVRKRTLAAWIMRADLRG